MEYTKQQKYLNRSRAWAGAVALVLIAYAAACLKISGVHRADASIVFGVTIAALAISLWYSLDYLHLTVISEKKANWEVKIRRRLIGAVLLLGAVTVGGTRGTVPVLIAAAYLGGANLLAKSAVPSAYIPAFFWDTDIVLLATLLLAKRLDLLLGAALLAAAAQLSILACESHAFRWAGVTFFSGGLLIFLLVAQRGANLNCSVSATGLLLVSALGTALLAHQAQLHNAQNIRAAMSELMDFTGYSADHIQHLWSVSNHELAKNWQAAKIPENDRERMAKWYRDNSELYLFAIDAYNLEYKRFRSNLGILKFASGSCLDYGAGNGELILELARSGHAAAPALQKAREVRLPRPRSTNG